MKFKHFSICCLLLAASLNFMSCKDDDDKEDLDNPPAEVTDPDDQQPETPAAPIIVGNYLYAEPCLEWRAPRSEIKTFMKDYTIYQESDEDLTYIGQYKETLVMYQFKDGSYTATVAFQPIQASISTLHAALNNKYDYLGSSVANGITMRMYQYAESDAVVVLAAYTAPSTTINMVLYMQDPTSSNKPARRNATPDAEAALISHISEHIAQSAKQLLP